MKEKNAGPEGVMRFFANPWLGVVGSIASVIGIPLAVYFYIESLKGPDLVYTVEPSRAIVVKQGTASRLAVSFDKRAIATDVTAVQLAIWNRGREVIRRQAILQPIVFRTDKNTPILEATIRKRSREVVQLELDQSRIAIGELQISWNVLEGGDGGLIQIVYAGNPELSIRGSGVIEGQPTLRELRFTGTIKSPSEQLRSERNKSYWLLFNTLIGALMLLYGLVRMREIAVQDRRNSRIERALDRLMYIIFPLVIIGVGIYSFFASEVPIPPFGFE